MMPSGRPAEEGRSIDRSIEPAPADPSSPCQRVGRALLPGVLHCATGEHARASEEEEEERGEHREHASGGAERPGA